jgi:hypothetical protein
LVIEKYYLMRYEKQAKLDEQTWYGIIGEIGIDFRIYLQTTV